MWAHSAFCFESANYYLLRAIKCGRSVIQQILRHINFERSVQILEKVVHFESSSNIEQYYKDIKISRTKKMFKLKDITYLGKELTIDRLESEKFNVFKITKVFSRMIMNHILYMSSEKVNNRSCNYYARLTNGQHIEIISFLVDPENRCELTLYRLISVRCNKNSNDIKEIVSIQDEIASVETRDIKRPAVFIKVLRKNYIIATPNSLFY